MNDILIFIEVFLLWVMIFYGKKYPIIFLIFAITCLGVSAYSFMSSNNNWVHVVWGWVMFLCAVYYTREYGKYNYKNH